MLGHAVDPTARILAADDEETNVALLARLLRRAGYEFIATTTHPRDVLELVRSFEPDLILLDLHMHEMNGLEVLEELATIIPRDTFLPIIMLSGDSSIDARQRALGLGATDFLTKPFDATEVLLRIRNSVQARRMHLQLQRHSMSLEDEVRARTQQLEEAQVEIVERLCEAAELRDDDTGRHTMRVGELAAHLARASGMVDEDVLIVRRAAPLHDVGKIGIPDGILLKPGALTPEETVIMRGHTVTGARILARGRSPLIQVAARIARSHHERWDGGGYPDGLAGEAIPVEARIVALADVYDALSHDRPYRRAWAKDRVCELIRSERGSHFDPMLTDLFLELV